MRKIAAPETVRGLIAALPKVELHLHVEGTLEPELVFELAEKNGVRLPYDSVEALRAAYQFVDLQSFLNVYYEATNVLQTEQDFYDMTQAYLARAHAENVVHAEIFFDPQSHTSRGVSFDTVMGGIRRALADGEAEYGITSALIMCFLRHLSEADAEETLQQALCYKEDIVGVGLDSGERGNPPAKFERVFQKARAQGFRVVAHAGEEGPPAYIREALDLLGAERIDHGVRCLEDDDLVARLAREQIPLTVCPMSNVKLRVFDDMEHHNLRDLLEAGLRVSINSDDPAYFGGYVGDNYESVAAPQGLSPKQLVELAKNAVHSSFLPNGKKCALLDRIEEAAAPYLGATEQTKASPANPANPANPTNPTDPADG